MTTEITREVIRQAGAFTIAKPKTGDYYTKNYSNNILQVEGQQVFALHQVPNNLGQRYKAFDTGNPEDRRVSQGCVNMKKSDFLEVAHWMKPTCKMYVLPEEKIINLQSKMENWN